VDCSIRVLHAVIVDKPNGPGAHHGHRYFLGPSESAKHALKVSFGPGRREVIDIDVWLLHYVVDVVAREWTLLAALKPVTRLALEHRRTHSICLRVGDSLPEARARARARA
jgi:hypothetical protein